MYRTEMRTRHVPKRCRNWTRLVFPKRTVKLHHKDKPWITPEYKNFIAKRQKAFIQGDHSLYCKLRNQLFREGKRLRSTFLNTKLTELKTNKNNRKLCNSVQQLAGATLKGIHL